MCYDDYAPVFMKSLLHDPNRSRRAWFYLNDDQGPCKTLQWKRRLSGLKFNVVHRSGIKYQAADTLSPLKSHGEDPTPLNAVMAVLVVSPDSLAFAPLIIELNLYIKKNPTVFSNHSHLPLRPRTNDRSFQNMGHDTVPVVDLL